jgi:hypothetical protein
MVRGCSSHRRSFAPVVRRPEDARAVLAAATQRGCTPCVVVGALTVDRRPVALVIVEGAAAADLPTVLDVVLEATADLTAVAFVATCGPHAALPGGALVDEAEQRCRRRGVELLEWFVPVGGAWVAVFEGQGRGWRW